MARSAPSPGTSAASWTRPERPRPFPPTTKDEVEPGPLRVARRAQGRDADKIKKAYRRLARELHPDVNPDPETQDRFKEVAGAYEVLSDPQKRAIYDRGGDPFGGAGGFGQGAGFSFADVFDAFFGGAGPARRPARPRPAPAHPARPGRADPRRGRAGRGGVRRAPGRSRSTPRCSCPTCDGECAAPGTHPTTATSAAARRVAQSAALVPRPGRHARPCPPAAASARSSRPVPRVRRRRPGPLAAHPHRPDPPGRRRRQPDPARRQGEVGPGGGPPATSTSRSGSPAPDVRPCAAPTCTARSRCR